MGEASGAAREPLSVLVVVLRHQQDRSGTVTATPGRAGADRFPLLDLGTHVVEAIVQEMAVATDALNGAVPAPLAEAGHGLRELGAAQVAAVVETWLDDVTLVEPRLGFWVQVAAGPVLERGSREVTCPSEWKGAACPLCGGLPQASVVAEESGEFMAGSPRSLVCSRCATWWSYPRVTCVGCGEDDSRRIESYLTDERRWARVDTCATCRGYIKTFDLRQPGAAHVVPLVDDVTTLTLDVWAQSLGFSRPSVSLAGV
jgi:formate dehydrogenase accessory protein FdhE